MSNDVECMLLITGDPDAVGECLASLGSQSTAMISDATIRPRQDASERRYSAQVDDFRRVRDPQLLDFSHVLPVRLGDERLTRWGTTSNAYSVTVERQPDGRGARIKFLTVNCPPTPVVQALADQFRHLGFELTYWSDAQIAGGWRWAPIDAGCDLGRPRAAVATDPDFCLGAGDGWGWERLEPEHPCRPYWTWGLRFDGPDPRKEEWREDAGEPALPPRDEGFEDAVRTANEMALARLMARHADLEVVNCERAAVERGKLERFYEYKRTAAREKVAAVKRTLDRVSQSDDTDVQRIVPVWRKNVQNAERDLAVIGDERERRLALLAGRETVTAQVETLTASWVEIHPELDATD